MLAESYTAVIARGEDWKDGSTTEPYEASWAREAIIVLRTLESGTLTSGAKAHVQISLDGMRWINEGTSLDIPTEIDGMSMARLGHFGHYLRLRAEMPAGATGFMLATLSLKA
ncbi:hypothetical protein [Neorhizobium sp. DT-125]|uniref:hypothetical protein n=1 Tax=Neorhizobium sp. DT-125 TaxID=3396163 RepID=UPI003F192C11